jgi:hypothetical protein
MKSRLNWNNKIIEIQIIISIVRVNENFSKMLVLSGVFNTTILDAPMYNLYYRYYYIISFVAMCAWFTGPGQPCFKPNFYE